MGVQVQQIEIASLPRGAEIDVVAVPLDGGIPPCVASEGPDRLRSPLADIAPLAGVGDRIVSEIIDLSITGMPCPQHGRNAPGDPGPIVG